MLYPNVTTRCHQNTYILLFFLIQAGEQYIYSDPKIRKLSLVCCVLTQNSIHSHDLQLIVESLWWECMRFFHLVWVSILQICYDTMYFILDLLISILGINHSWHLRDSIISFLPWICCEILTVMKQDHFSLLLRMRVEKCWCVEETLSCQGSCSPLPVPL